MTEITDRANDTYRDFQTFGVPASGIWEPPKRDIRELFSVVDTALGSLGVNGAIEVKKATRAALFSDLGWAAGTLAVVYNDPTQGYNGIYAKSGGVSAGFWSLTSLALPASFADDIAHVMAQSESVLAAADAFGDVAEEIGAGSGVVVYEDGAFQVINREDFKGDPGGNAMAVGLFSAISGLSIPNGTDVIQTTGYNTKGSGLARYVSVAAGPANAYRVQTSNGRWFELAEDFPTLEMFGAAGDGIVDDLAAIQAADGRGAWIMSPGKTYRVSASVTLASPFTASRAASFSIDASATLTVQRQFTVYDDHQVFAGAGAVSLTGDNRDVMALWFGGSVSDVGPGVQRAWESGARRIRLPSCTQTWATPVTLSTAAGYRPLTIVFGGDVIVAAGIRALSWQRTPTPNTGFILELEGNGALIGETGLGQTSFFLDFRGKAVTAGMTITRSGTTATVTTPSPHGFATGRIVEIEGANETAYNGRFTATVTGATTFTYTVAGAPATPATGSMAVSGLETGNYNDSRLIIRNLEFRGLFRGFYTERTGLAVDTVVGRFNAIVWESGRDSSFVSVFRYLGVANKTDIYYVDVSPNGLSNGVELRQVYSVLATGGFGGITITGVEVVLGDSNSVDICSSGSYSLVLDRCQRNDVRFVWLAGDMTTSPTHRAANITGCFHGTFFFNHVVNHDVGVVVDKGLEADPAQFNWFGFGTLGLMNSAALLNFDTTCSVIAAGYRFLYKPSRTGSNYEFYNSAGDYWIIGKGMMKQASYTVSFGANSAVEQPLFVP